MLISAADSTKNISISSQQPDTTSKLTPYLFEGDILLSTKQAVTLLNTLASSDAKNKKDSRRRLAQDAPFYLFRGYSHKRKKRFSSDPEAKWISFPIKYRFDESLGILQISQILEAVGIWQNITCITFENDQNANGDYLEFFEGDGCYSMIGRFGGRQGVSIGKGCERMGIIVHELGHMLGLWHEQSRPDASKHITVVKNDILPSYVGEFLERSVDEITTFNVPYDLGSIMHYGSTAFSKDQKSKTLLTKDPLYQMTIGQRESLSFYDVKLINEAYCKGHCKEKDLCKNGGYLNPSNCRTCLCPSGFGGSKCDAYDDSTKYQYLSYHFIAIPLFPTLNNVLAETRIEISFEHDFGIFCSSTCVDYVELKIGDDLANTGYRICCYDKPEEALISAKNQIVIIFRTTVGEDIGFKLQFRKTTEPARTTPVISKTTVTTAPRTTIAGSDIWSEWGQWSQCSRPCGGCGIQSRVRICQTAQCNGKSQEFSTCNLQACSIDPKCVNDKSRKRICADGRKFYLIQFIFRLAHDTACSQPICCPPFYNVNGKCQSDQPVLSLLG
ncbi:unnamed protein product [Thelazia callipaeda]|uniref:Metalloendopeptidase n=1 Tax=Thelazia callipaeda TaxID=103827 RepID=A0A0N5D0Q5_THECL|nr:unnamed protein product [Thelazia callipaeda]